LKILFDTNVVLDVLLNREPHAIDGIKLFSAVENKIIQGFLCATTITTIDYLCTKAIGRKPAKQAINALLELFSIAEVNRKVLVAAIESDFSDFEDAVLYQAGVYGGVDGFVTRNIKDFALAEHPIYAPSELCGIIQSSSG
jgi:predicted nucleic acid-binding protein